MVRYYGWYSNKKRGMRKKDGKLNKTTTLSEDLTDYQKSCRKRWDLYLPLPLLTKEGIKGRL
mgnify:CR=1 FL=1